ncbi:MAG: DUF4268 domain-containing protein [Bacteroidales bacterium]|jgi:hypothetical protein|nr:DUF4268 domain-containing protein [Bacteroidales bacterium]
MFSKEEAKALRLEFWNRFKAISEQERRKRGFKKTWMLKQTGVKGLSLRFDVDREHVAVGFEIYFKNKFKEALLMESFEGIRHLLEAELEGPLVWDDAYVTEEERECARIYVQMKDVDIFQKADWEKMWSFMMKNMFIMEQFFVDYREFIENYENL